MFGHNVRGLKPAKDDEGWDTDPREDFPNLY